MMKTRGELSFKVLAGPEDRTATRSARTTTLLIFCAAVGIMLSPLEERLLVAQKAAVQLPEIPKVDETTQTKPFIKEKEWRLMTLPVSSWAVTIEVPEEKPVPPKPEVKPEPKPEKKPAPKAAPQKASIGSAREAPRGVGSAANVDAMNQALAVIIDVIERHKQYPKRARDIGLEGTTVLQVRVNDAGVVVGYSLKEGGNALFRRATLAAARHLDNLKTGADRAAVIDVPITYRLQ
ncbi:MAG TPA: TonB family protein [Candidatus Aphodousia gallistercoris]|nr:TonB family protein [Candidatus Aphodousia gallistercoris]